MNLLIDISSYKHNILPQFSIMQTHFKMPYQGKNFDPNYQNRQVQQVGNYKGRNYDPNFQANRMQSQGQLQRPPVQNQQQKPSYNQNGISIPQQRFQNNTFQQQPQLQNTQFSQQQPNQQYNNLQQANNQMYQQKQQAKFYSMDSVVNFIAVSDEIKLLKNKDRFFQVAICAKQNQLSFYSLKAGQVDFIFRINMVKTNESGIDLYVTDLLLTDDFLFVATNFGVFGCKIPQLTVETTVGNKNFGTEGGQNYKITEPNFANLQRLQLKKISSNEKVCRDLHFSLKTQMLSFIEGEFDYVNDTFQYTADSSLQMYQLNQQSLFYVQDPQDIDQSGITNAIMSNILSCKNMYIMVHCDGLNGETVFVYRDLMTGDISLSMVHQDKEVVNCKLFPEERLHHHLNFHQMFRIGGHQAFLLVSQQNSIVSILFNEQTQQVTQQFIMKDGNFYSEINSGEGLNNYQILNMQQFDTYFIIHCVDGRMLRISLTVTNSMVQHNKIQRLFNPAKIYQQYKQERNEQKQKINYDNIKVISSCLSKKSTLAFAFLEGEINDIDAKCTLCFHQLKENKAIDVEKEITLLL